MKEAQGERIRANITRELEGKKCTKKDRMQIRIYFLLKVGKTAKYLKINKKY